MSTVAWWCVCVNHEQSLTTVHTGMDHILRGLFCNLIDASKISVAIVDRNHTQVPFQFSYGT